MLLPGGSMALVRLCSASSRHERIVSHWPADASRFEALYRTHYGAIVRFVRRRADPASVEEIVAETFAIAWKRLDDVPGDELPWLYGVARNVLYSAYRAAIRAREKTARQGEGTRSDHGRDPSDVVAEREHTLQAFAALSEDDREALRLVAWEGLDHQQAARVMGTTRVAFAMRVSRARRRLAVALADTDVPAETPAVPTPTLLEGQT